MGSDIAELEKAARTETPSPEPPRERNHVADTMANPRFKRMLIGAGAALVVATIVLLLYYHNRVSTDDAQVDGHITPIASKIYGNVLQVLVDDNQHVKAGQVLARIDPRDYQAKVAQAEAALALAEGQAEAASVGVPWPR